MLSIYKSRWNFILCAEIFKRKILSAIYLANIHLEYNRPYGITELNPPKAT